MTVFGCQSRASATSRCRARPPGRPKHCCTDRGLRASDPGRDLALSPIERVGSEGGRTSTSDHADNERSFLVLIVMAVRVRVMGFVSILGGA
jgi:hypothetical protein